MPTADFQPLKPHELDRLSDNDLILHADRARLAEDLDQARAAIGRVIAGRWAFVRSLVLRKVDPASADDIAAQVFEDALKARFDGCSMGEFVNLLKTITQRRVADFHKQRERRPEIDSLDDEDSWATPPAADDEAAVDAQDAIDRVRAALSDVHRQVVDLRIEGYSSKETCDLVDAMTPANVDQIVSRFRKALRGALEGERMDP